MHFLIFKILFEYIVIYVIELIANVVGADASVCPQFCAFFWADTGFRPYRFLKINYSYKLQFIFQKKTKGIAPFYLNYFQISKSSH